jgi:AhpD family alkylhydroperoxidase
VGIPDTTLYLVHLRTSQINGCSVCVDIHSRELEHAGESSERIHTVAVAQDAIFQRRRARRAGPRRGHHASRRPCRPVPDEVWDEAARHYTEAQLGAFVVATATINGYNRVNAATRQMTGQWVAQLVEAQAA